MSMSPEEIEEIAIHVALEFLKDPTQPPPSLDSYSIEDRDKILYRAGQITLGSPFKMKVSSERWFGVWGTNG